jgi:hypothetical protein
VPCLQALPKLWRSLAEAPMGRLMDPNSPPCRINRKPLPVVDDNEARLILPGERMRGCKD